jgi:hypothetical protein
MFPTGQLKPWHMLFSGPTANGAITASVGYDTEEQAKAAAAQHVAANKGGVGVVYEAKQVAMTPTPMVDWKKPEDFAAKK